MKTLLRSSSLIFIMLAVSMTAIGQYTGSNPEIATGKFALASDSTVTHEPGKAVDGTIGTYASVPGSAPAWISIDLGDYYYIDGYDIVLPNAGELPDVYNFHGSTDGTVWSILATGAVSAAGTYGFDISLTSPVRWVRIYMTSKDAVASFSEIRVYGYAEVPPMPPTSQPATDIGPFSFTANWSERVTATNYVISVATDPGFANRVDPYQAMDVGDVTSFNITGLNPVTTYYYRVRALNFTGSSAYSNTVQLTTLQAPQTITFDSLPAYTYGDADFDLTATASSGLTVSYASSDESVATVTGTNVSMLAAGTTTITATQDGDGDYLAADPVAWDLVVNPKELTVSGTVTENKVYDGNTDAVLSGAILEGVIGVEDVNLADDAAGTFAQAGIGTGIAITTAMTLSGADISNYVLTQPADLVADITARELTVSGAVAESKIYDGTTDATISGATLEGVVAGEDVVLNDGTMGTFAQAGIGAGLAVTTSMSFGGADEANYTFTAPSGLSADITAKDLTVTANDESREACAPNPDFTISYLGFVDGENSSVLSTLPAASCTADESSPAGPYDITVSGGSADNYMLVYVTGTLTVTADVTPPVLTVQNITVQLDDNGDASITPADVVTGASDNCSIADTTLSQSAFTSVDKGEVSVTVTLTDMAGNSVEESITVTVEGGVGFEEFSEINIEIYPNPTRGPVMVDINAPIDGLKVMDMTGRTILTRSRMDSDESIDLTGHSNGIYIFQIKTGEDLRHFRIIKK